MNKINIMKNEKVSKALIKLGLPAIIGLLINAVYNVVDTYFVSSISTEAVGGAAIAFPLTMIVVGVGGIFGQGAASYISRLLGEENKEEANNTAISSCIYSLGLSLILMAIVLPLLEPILRALGATSTILPYAKEYTFIYMLGSPFGVMSINLNNVARSEGAAKTSMTALICGAVLNMILDAVFIFVLNMGIRGAAVATVISQIFTTTFLIVYFLGKNSYLKIRLKSYKWSMRIITEMIKVGVPTFIFQLLTSCAIGLTNVKASAFGDAAVASVGIITKLMSLGLYFVFGYTKGLQPFVGYNYGANNISRVQSAIKYSLKLTTIFCIILSTLFIIFSKNIMGLFSNVQDVIDIGARGLVANNIFFVTFGFQMVYATLFLAFGRGREGAILCLLRQGICLIPLLIILPDIFGLDGVLFSQGIADLLTACITLFFAIKISKELKDRKLNNCDSKKA